MKKVLFSFFTICLFVFGFFLGKVVYAVPTKEIRVGYENKQGDVHYKPVLTDEKNQRDIHNLEGLFMNRIKLYEEEIKQDESLQKKPNLYLLIHYPKDDMSSFDTKVWFTKEGAILGTRVGETEEIEYSYLNMEDAKTLQHILQYKK